jgi:hypothetical protein
MRLGLLSRQARLTGATIVSFLITSFKAGAVDLFEFEDGDRQYIFAVEVSAPVPASVDQEQATQRALDWAWILWTSPSESSRRGSGSCHFLCEARALQYSLPCFPMEKSLSRESSLKSKCSSGSYRSVNSRTA